MTVHVTVEGIDELRKNLGEFGKDQTRILNRIVLKVAGLYRNFIKSNYLSGQYLASRTGRLKDSMIAYKVRGEKAAYWVSSRAVQSSNGIAGLANIYGHAGGANIVPKNAKVLAIPASNDAYVANSGFGKAYHGEWIFIARAHLEAKPFMQDSSSAFGFDSALSSAADMVMAKEIAKRFPNG